MLTNEALPLGEEKEGKEEEFDDDDSSSTSSTSTSNNVDSVDSNTLKLNIYSDPLSLINPYANLDDVLNAKTIGEAIQILCPQLPGLPSKQRGKYKQRRFLTEDQREEIMRARNRDNARRTRKRKKLYVTFLSNAIKALEAALSTEGGTEDGTKANDLLVCSEEALLLARRNRGRPSKKDPLGNPLALNGPNPSTGVIPNSFPSTASMEHRIEVIAQFLRTLYRSENNVNSASNVSSNSTSKWPEFSVPEIIHRTPIGAHKDPSLLLSTSTSLADFHENKGYRALENEVQSNVKFFDSLLVRKNCRFSHVWRSQILIDSNGIMFNGTKDRISLEYELIIKLLPSSDLTSAGSILIHLPVLLLADYSENGLLTHVEEQFDVLDLIRQRELW